MFSRKYFADLAERVIATAAQALLGALTVTELSWTHKGQIVGVAALAAFLKGLAATQVGAENTAALLPAGPDTDKG